MPTIIDAIPSDDEIDQRFVAALSTAFGIDSKTIMKEGLVENPKP
jgi:hypothetical protein